MSRRTLPLPFAVDLRRSLYALRLGKHDPTIDLRPHAVALAMWTPQGAASLRALHTGDAIDVEAWGEGADWALDQSPAMLGLLDDRVGFRPRDDVVARLHRQADGLRLPRTGRIMDALVPAVLSQRVTGFEAKRSYRSLVDRWGEPAPGPTGLQLRPRPEVIAELGYYDLHVIGVERKRADTLKRVCAHASRLEALATSQPAVLRGRLEALAGVGPWTSAEVSRVGLGDADAVSVGDVHLKHLVSWALAGEPRGTDARMLELLEPYVGHRGRVCTLLESSGLSAPRYGPRQRIERNAER
ncbi:MAG: DNA-3-methyladenine glycosylase family protein [Acidimicrobiales bacterium]